LHHELIRNPRSDVIIPCFHLSAKRRVRVTPQHLYHIHSSGIISSQLSDLIIEGEKMHISNLNLLTIDVGEDLSMVPPIVKTGKGLV
jgi:hypothetical protein